MCQSPINYIWKSTYLHTNRKCKLISKVCNSFYSNTAYYFVRILSMKYLIWALEGIPPELPGLVFCLSCREEQLAYNPTSRAKNPSHAFPFYETTRLPQLSDTASLSKDKLFFVTEIYKHIILFIKYFM